MRTYRLRSVLIFILFFTENSMATKLIFAVILVVFQLSLNGCASILDGKFVTKDGKESPFNPMEDRYAPPKNPNSPF